MAKRRVTDEEYAEMAASYEAEPPRADEIISVEINPAYLRNGRPGGTGAARGTTPTMAIRLPGPIRAEVEDRVKAGEARSTSELIRVAVVEYLERHPH